MTESAAAAAAATATSSSSTGEAKELELSVEVMSEVHLGCPPRFSGPFVSYFTFSLSSSSEDMGGRFDGLVEAGRSIAGQVDGLDEDGDLVLPRRKKAYNVAIQHKITSSIPNVGLQVWKAALVLADFVLHISITSSDFDDISALELGAGTGDFESSTNSMAVGYFIGVMVAACFVGIILARVANKVFLTDRDAEILDNCATNAHLNSFMFKHHEASVHVRELDWKKSWPPSAETCDLAAKRSEYSWTLSEIEEAERVSLLLAADVIYSDELTDSFFSVLESLMSRGSKKVLYLALEKRFNFSLDDLDVVANGYLHFRSFLRDEECSRLEDASTACFMAKQIDLAGLPQYIREYERGKDLEIWKIAYVAVTGSNAA